MKQLFQHINLAACLLLSIGIVGAAEDTWEKFPPGYSIEKITTPVGVQFGVSGLAMDRHDNLFVCTREGQVWKFSDPNWLLVAEGLHEPLGILVEESTGHLLVVQRPEFTRLIDENGDGKADFLQTISDDWGLTDNYHEYAFGLVHDKDGNYYGTLNTSLSWPGWAGSDRWDIARVHDSKMGRAAPYRGWSFQISPQGTFTPWSAGLRSPAGLGINNSGDIFYTDNQGDWNASSSLHQIVRGRFHGHPSSLMDHPDFAGKDLNSISTEDYHKMWTRPAVWLPHGELANSPGEPTFDKTQGKFGPFAGQFFIGDQTMSNLMRVSLEKVGGEYQGAVWNFIRPLECGVIRQVFDSQGRMYVGQTGRGWRSAGKDVFGLRRITWDGSTVPMEMKNIRLTQKGFRIVFTHPVDEAVFENPENFQVESWGYLYHANYGSPKVDEKKLPVDIRRAPNNPAVVIIDLPLETEKVYKFTLSGIQSQTGVPLTNSIGYYTLNRLKAPR
ncbi:MAG: hypothetical protein LR011_06735 [Verrucomicrobia bacterium]|nr:hypothetical protein [Verrucomicrobiota bacterium]